MAPLSFTLATATSTCSPFFSQTPIQQRPFKTHAKQTHRFQISCNVSSDEHGKPLNANPPPQKLILPQTPSLDLQNVDRRNLLLGLGGLYTTVNFTDLPPAFANPITSPFPTCKPASSGFNTNPENVFRTTECCPPKSKFGDAKDYEFPDSGETRVRKPLHLLTPTEIKNFRDGIQKMKDLPDDDPRSFTNQAKVHCAYCNGSYMQDGKQLQIHNSWLFFPFHRWYLYFFERILGDQMGDPTFGLPYWNWDNPDGGMVIPDFILEEKLPGSQLPNPLYDVYRDAVHARITDPPTLDLDYNGMDRIAGKFYSPTDINLTSMKRQMMRNAFDGRSFFGGRYVAGSEPIGNGDNLVGSIEAGCHTAVHRWVGDSKKLNHEDMGNFYSAGFDPLFYLHHSNVDRMWFLWKDMKIDGKEIPGHKEPDEDDWKNASYVFFDENQKPVRVYNRDTPNLGILKYRFEDSPTIKWETRKIESRCKSSGSNVSNQNVKAEDFVTNLDLSKTVQFQLKRPNGGKKRTPEEKKNVKEILCLFGINFDGERFVKLDVIVNGCGDIAKISPCESEFAGAFSTIPHKKDMTMVCKSGARLGLNELLEEIDADGDESVQVTIVRRTEGKDVSIDRVEIQLIDVSK